VVGMKRRHLSWQRGPWRANSGFTETNIRIAEIRRSMTEEAERMERNH